MLWRLQKTLQTLSFSSSASFSFQFKSLHSPLSLRPSTSRRNGFVVKVLLCCFWDEIKHIRHAIAFLVTQQKRKRTLHEISYDLSPVFATQMV
uniref:Uncharacterized protein n=1 Tax=Lactuca sativa TaxID=4236 RepID=A0A9R1WD63_LACSA|nr:hypothetical protein LSAT_V11C200070190 [Lactuca sativa]